MGQSSKVLITAQAEMIFLNVFGGLEFSFEKEDGVRGL